MRSQKQRRNNRLIFYLIFAYILASFLWWAVLFLRNNQSAYERDLALARQSWLQHGTAESFEGSRIAQSLSGELKRKNGMIIGEGLVFITLISIGFWRIQASFKQEIEVTRQQNNFILAITHELKSPLASIRLGLETLIQRQLPAEKVQQIAQMNVDDVDRLERLVENILLAARLEDPNHRFNKSGFNLSQLCETLLLKERRRHPEMQLEAAIESDLYIHGDEFAWASVLINLLENAVKYTDTPGPVGMHLSQDQQQIILKVWDRGSGIPDEEKDKVFQRFYRIGNEETRASKGTGLGLFLVRQIVAAHGGKIHVQDHHPGACFVISVPQKLSAAIEAQTSPAGL